MKPVVLVSALLLAACHAQPEPVITGGYAPADAASADTQAAQKLAVDEVYKREPQRSIVEKVTSEVQVVAGLNYRFTIDMSGQNAYRVVVYKPLQGAMQVTGFEKLPAAN